MIMKEYLIYTHEREKENVEEIKYNNNNKSNNKQK